MNEKQKSYAMLASLALNIFLVAFMLGRGSAMLPGFSPPMGGMPPMVAGSMMPPGMPGGNPMARPPFIMPGMVLSKEEMDAELGFAMARFQKMHALREQFAADVEKDDLTPAQIKQHFEQIEAVMEELKNHMKEKITAKLTRMSPEERRRFVKEMMRE